MTYRFLALLTLSITLAAQNVWQSTGWPSSENARVVTNSAGIVYIGTGSGKLYSTADNGATYQLHTGTLTQPVNGYAFTSLIIASDGSLVGGGSPLPYWYNGVAWTQGTGASTDLTMYMARDSSGNIGGGITFSGAFNYSTDNGHTWNVRTNTGGAVFSIYFARDGCFYVGGEVSGVHRSCDGGNTWTNLGLPTGGINDGANVHAIMEDAHGRIYAGCRGGLSRWTGAGISWIDITSIPRRNAITGTGDINVRSVLTLADESMLVATDSGIFRSTDNGDTFTLWNTGVNQQSGASADRNQMTQDSTTGLVYVAAGLDGVYRTVYPMTFYSVQADNFVTDRTAGGTVAQCTAANPAPSCLWFQSWQNFSIPTFTFANNAMNVLFGNNDQPQLTFRSSQSSNFGHWVPPCTLAPSSGGTCTYLQSYVTAGLFQPTVNRLKFQATCDVSSAQAATGTANGVQFGTYVNSHTDQANGPPHYYHYYNPTFVNGHTMTYIVNEMPQHNNSSGGGSDQYPVDPEFNAPTTPGGPFHYFDGMASTYWADNTGGFSCGRGNEGCNGAVTGHNCRFANAYFGTVGNEPDAWVASLEGGYGATVGGVVSVDRYEVNWAAPKLVVHGVVYDIAYSTAQSLKTLGFSNGTSGGTVTSFDNLGYTNTRWQSGVLAEAISLWVGLRPHMVVSAVSNASPPIATFLTTGSSPSAPLYHNLTSGDKITIAGVSGGSLTGTFYAKVVDLSHISIYTDIALTNPAGAAVYTCPTQCTITSAMDFTGFSEIQLTEQSALGNSGATAGQVTISGQVIIQ